MVVPPFPWEDDRSPNHILMSQQHNKVIKKKRRVAYLKRQARPAAAAKAKASK